MTPRALPAGRFPPTRDADGVGDARRLRRAVGRTRGPLADGPAPGGRVATVPPTQRSRHPQPPSQLQPSSSTNSPYDHIHAHWLTHTSTFAHAALVRHRRALQHHGPPLGRLRGEPVPRRRPAELCSSASSPGPAARPSSSAPAPRWCGSSTCTWGSTSPAFPRVARDGAAGGPAHPAARRRGEPVTRQGPAAPDRGSPRVACGRFLGLPGHSRRGAPEPRA